MLYEIQCKMFGIKHIEKVIEERPVDFVTLHLGGDVIIPMKDVIAIFDLETSQTSEVNNEFLEIAKEEGFIKKVSEDMPKTFVLAELEHKTMIFLSPISSSTLLKRTGFIQNISFSNNLAE